MTRDPGPDDGREEAYDDDGSAARATGIITSSRYLPQPGPQPTETQLDHRAHLDAMQEMADSGRPVHTIPWWGKARDKAKVKHRQWDRRPNGWSHCKRCAFAAPTSDDAAKIVHQDDHKERDRVLQQLSEDFHALAKQNADLREELQAAWDEIAAVRMDLDVLMVATGNASMERLQAIVERIMNTARRVSAAQNGGPEPP